jgi:hypothetical protein
MGGLTIPCGEDVFLEITSSLNWIHHKTDIDIRPNFVVV